MLQRLAQLQPRLFTGDASAPDSTLLVAPAAPEPESELIAGVPYAALHPYRVGWLWFSTCGFLAGIVFGIFSSIISVISSHQHGDLLAMLGQVLLSLGYGVVGGSLAALPGAALGAAICRGKITTRKQAGRRGILVAFVSQLVIAALFAYAWPHSFELALIWKLLIGVVLTTFVPGAITLPFGYFGGTLLFRFRSARRIRPQGCRRHGYRLDAPKPKQKGWLVG